MLCSEIYKKDLVTQLANVHLSELRNKSIAITGASGLICSYIIDAIMTANVVNNFNTTVYAFGRDIKKLEKRFECFKNNPLLHFTEYTIYAPFPLIKTDFIIHGASPAYPEVFASDPVGTMNSNYIGLMNVLEAAKKIKCRILFISSSEIYGAGIQNKIWDENDSGSVNTMNYRSCYPSSKRAAETLCAAYKEQFGVDCVVVRPCHIYGPTMTEHDNRAVTAFLRQALKKEPIVMRSEGKAVRSYCYAGDCFTAIMSVLLFGNSGEAYNISNKDAVISVKNLAEIISSISEIEYAIDIPVAVKTGFNTVDEIILSSVKLENLGWKAKYPIADGITRTLEIARNKVIRERLPGGKI